MNNKIYSREFEILCKKHKIPNLCHFTHIDNLNSILKEGLLPEEEVERRKIKLTSIADAEVKSVRRNKTIPLSKYQGKTVSQFVPLYISAKNPMLYKILYGYKIPPENVIIIKVDTLKIIKGDYCFFDGNAASEFSKAYIRLEQLEKLDWKAIKQSSWADDEEKRKKCAEFLVYPKVEPQDFYQIVVFNEKTKTKVEEILKKHNFQLKGKVEINSNYYIW